MISWLDDNPLGKVLAGLCAACVVIVLLLGVAWTLPPSGNGDTAADNENTPSLVVPEIKSGEPIEAYAVITERPVFNQGRQPIIAIEVDDEELVDEEESEVDAPAVALAGVVITPSLKMATLKPEGESASLVAFEGQPLEGDYGSWQVSRIGPRDVTLRSGSGEEVRLELQIHDAVIKEPPKMKPKETVADAGDEPAAEEAAPLSRAEEIRQRIAERREELRRAAEEDSADPEKPANYRAAIQSLMQRNQKQAKDENEQ